MSDQGKISQLKTLAAGFLGFVGVVGLGSLLILHHGGAAVKAPVVAYPPVDAGSALSAPARVAEPSLAGAPLGGSNAAVSSPAPLLPDEARDDGSPAAAQAAVSAAGGAVASAKTPAAAAPKLVVGAHLDSAASASSSASMPVASVPKLKRKAAPALAEKPFFAPKLDLSKNQGIAATTIHYGVSDRAELMGRAAGPVYNFSGNALGQQSAQVAADNAAPNAAGALQQVEAAQKQLDASNVAADQKAQIDQNLNQIRQAAPAPSGQ
ncbi:MAG TPA: hypothetical protein VH309_11030 [Elusimicrobiota bacterium]|jgi:hypothetical protein|nr:hypothetical protein [Elusimicrobiota bacterium]